MTKKPPSVFWRSSPTSEFPLNGELVRRELGTPAGAEPGSPVVTRTRLAPAASRPSRGR